MGRAFESPQARHVHGVEQCVPVPKGSGLREQKQDGPLAQLVEQLTLNQRATGSSPVRPTIRFIVVGLGGSGRTAREGAGRVTPRSLPPARVAEWQTRPV